ncbi:DnaJ domain, conserved site,DnaJ domain [Cinara cedri]|uniref:DnaJ domain, conserved site,DnaJ domain n=1 Tax=Cinara cedri TaxID=506608 RepID=A0A5E4NFF9_9HEMI|nr:DnaJ domain, conserved site,DnaJ domain [Cinara cedri]
MNNICILRITFRIVRLGFKDTSKRCQSTKQKLSTHYDVLNLKPGCTKKEIRNSFIKLSKLTHPDVCGSSSNDRFISINAAYNVLIDENKKKIYDQSLMRTSTNTYNNYSNIVYYPPCQNRKSWRDDSENYWLSSNITIAAVCFSILIIGSVIRYIGVKKSVSVRSMLMDESDDRLIFLEKQKLMKTNKTNAELIEIFEKNILKEYGQVKKK